MRWLISIVMLVVFAGCAPPVTFGQISSKEFVPEHEEETLTYDAFTETWKTETETVPDSWYVTLMALVADEKGHFNTTTHRVQQHIYDNVREGEYYRIGDLTSTKECPTRSPSGRLTSTSSGSIPCRRGSPPTGGKGRTGLRGTSQFVSRVKCDSGNGANSSRSSKSSFLLRAYR